MSSIPPLKENLPCFICGTDKPEDIGIWLGGYFLCSPECLDKFQRQKRKVIVEGVSKDAPMVTNEQGGRQSQSLYDFTQLAPTVMLRLAGLAQRGKEKYGPGNWRLIPVDDHLNHALTHIFAHMAGDDSDDHLLHALWRVQTAIRLEEENDA